METKYATLRRPKRKLCYFSDKDRPTKQWAGMLSLGDIDRMFDDLEPSDHEEDVVLPPSPLLHIDDTEATQSEMAPSPIEQLERLSSEETQKSPKGCSYNASPSPGKDIDLDCPAQGPVKTSSPIKDNKGVDIRGINKKDRAISPILFLCEDDDGEQAKLKPLLSPKCISSKNDPVTGKANRKAELESRITPARPKKILSSGEVVTRKPEGATLKTKAGDVQRQPLVERPRQMDKSMSTFLQKLRDGSQPTPSSSRKPVSPLKAPTGPEEDFFILEDDAPLLFRIPRATSSNKRRNRTSGTVIDGQTSQSSPGNPSETVQKEQEYSDANNNPQSPIVDKLKMNTRGKVKKTEITKSESHQEKLCPPVDRAVVERLVHEKPIKKQSRVKQVSFEKSHVEDTLNVKPQDTSSEATDLEEPSGTMRKKSKKNTELKKPKAVKHSKEVGKKKTLKMDRKGERVVKQMPHVEAEAGENQEQSNDEHGRADDPALLSGDELNNGEASKTKGKRKKLPVVLEESSSTEGQIGGKRQRRPPGQWWLSSALSAEGADVTEPEPTGSMQSPAKRKKGKDLERLNEKEPVPSTSQKKSQARGKKPKQNKSGGQVRAKPRKTLQKVFVETEAEQVDVQEEQHQEMLDSDPLKSSPLLIPLRDHSSSSGEQTFQRVYHNPSAKTISAPASTSAGVCREQLQETDADKRRRKVPCDWWVAGNQVDDVSLPQPQQVKPVKGRINAKQNKVLGLGSPKNGNVAVSSKPPGGAPGPSRKVKLASAKKAVKRSLAAFMDSVPTAVGTPSKASRELSGLTSKQEVTVRDSSPRRPPEAQNASRTDAGEPNRVRGYRLSGNQSDNTSKVIRSGPSSMIQLEDYQDNDMTLPSSRVSTVLSVSDLCAPPLEPLALQPKDKGNLSEWFRSLWSVESGADVTPDQFDWYCYQGRAFGIHVDLNSGSFCSGKMLLGSYMKKPLWVDHSATTVFHLVTSSVNVVINGSGSRFHPAQAFVVPCGHAYSIQNVSAQPAVLYFTRIFSESSD